MYLKKIDIKKTYSQKEFLKLTSHKIVQIANERIKESGRFSLAFRWKYSKKYFYKFG